MTRSTFWVTVSTEDTVKIPDYTSAAAALVDVLQTIFGDRGSIATVTGSNSITDATTEVEVRRDESRNGTVTARALFEVEAPGRVQLQKPKLTALIRAQLPFSVKVHKSVVRDDSPGIF